MLTGLPTAVRACRLKRERERDWKRGNKDRAGRGPGGACSSSQHLGGQNRIVTSLRTVWTT